MPYSVNAAIKASALVGTFTGQIVFGLLADIYGRRGMFGLSMSILVFAALGQGAHGTQLTHTHNFLTHILAHEHNTH